MKDIIDALSNGRHLIPIQLFLMEDQVRFLEIESKKNLMTVSELVSRIIGEAIATVKEARRATP